jgi:hypothetical protein
VSVPISARMFSAPVVLIPGVVSQNSGHHILAGSPPRFHLHLRLDLFQLDQPSRIMIRLRHRRSAATQRPPQWTHRGDANAKIGRRVTAAAARSCMAD